MRNASAKQDPAILQKPAPNQDLIQRLEQLESRVAILENMLFSTVKLEKTRAERLLLDRQNRYKNSRALYAQGMITEAEMQQDRLRLAEAEKEFELANAESRQKELASELELVEAERRLQAATDELAYCRNMARRGFATQSEVERLEKVVDEAKLSLENAKLKLKSAKELEAPGQIGDFARTSAYSLLGARLRNNVTSPSLSARPVH